MGRGRDLTLRVLSVLVLVIELQLGMAGLPHAAMAAPATIPVGLTVAPELDVAKPKNAFDAFRVDRALPNAHIPFGRLAAAAAAKRSFRQVQTTRGGSPLQRA